MAYYEQIKRGLNGANCDEAQLSVIIMGNVERGRENEGKRAKL